MMVNGPSVRVKAGRECRGNCRPVVVAKGSISAGSGCTKIVAGRAPTSGECARLRVTAAVGGRGVFGRYRPRPRPFLPGRGAPAWLPGRRRTIGRAACGGRECPDV